MSALPPVAARLGSVQHFREVPILLQRILRAVARNIDSLPGAAAQHRFVAVTILILFLRQTPPLRVLQQYLPGTDILRPLVSQRGNTLVAVSARTQTSSSFHGEERSGVRVVRLAITAPKDREDYRRSYMLPWLSPSVRQPRMPCPDIRATTLKSRDSS
jgi:hypothetical protein